jgi:uncharacterized lipoprotein YmbA
MTRRIAPSRIAASRIAAPRIALITVLALVAGCASLPSRRIYVLDPPGAGAGDVVSLRERPQVALLPVAVPDYLDTTDILLRGDGHEIVARDTARWGERLSVGVTHALAAALQARRPDLGIASAGAIEGRPRRLLVHVDALDIWPDGHCVLAARWSLLDSDGETVLANLGGSFSAPAAATPVPGDAEIVGAVTRAVGDLAAAIAASLPRR